ncbi:hypothetical protein ILYODFUR_033942 [Ilyodon furcidens]|uniref:Uncharacterized protein n=1 Tax=Ilyodon furcidens TaxID=33524 RepID=A0ABV0T2H2_9TELE
MSAAMAEAKTLRERMWGEYRGRKLRSKVEGRIERATNKKKTTVSPKVIAQEESLACLLLYLFTPSSHLPTSPSQQISPLYLSNHPSAYLSLYPSASSYHPPQVTVLI